MVEENQDYSEVLTQPAAVKFAVNNTGREILKQHISIVWLRHLSKAIVGMVQKTTHHQLDAPPLAKDDLLYTIGMILFFAGDLKITARASCQPKTLQSL